MLRVARAHVRTHASAEEVVQEAWLGVVRALDGFEGRAELRTWVFRILVNVGPAPRPARGSRMNAELRRADRRPATGSATTTTRTPATGATTPPRSTGVRSPRCSRPSSVLCWSAALAELPERQRAVVELRDVHGLDGEEVCELLDLSPANQRVLLHRGRARLRGVLEGVIA